MAQKNGKNVNYYQIQYLMSFMIVDFESELKI